MATFNAGVLNDSAPVNRWVIDVQGQDWLELALIQCVNQLTKPSFWNSSDTTSKEIAAERSTDAAITLRKETQMIGTIGFTASSSPPEYALLCDGSTYNKADFPVLYEKLASPFIVSATQFKVPDLIGRFVLGIDDELNQIGGEETHTLTIAETPPHTHEESGHTHIESAVGVTAGLIGEIPSPVAVAVPANTSMAFVNLNTVGSGHSHNNMPPYVTLMPYIVAR